MATFSEKLAAAKTAERPFKDVQVTLDQTLSAKRDDLIQEIRTARLPAADARLTKKADTSALEKELADLEASEQDSMVTLRVVQAPGQEFSGLTAKYPFRADAPLDRAYGFNIHGLVAAEGHRWTTYREGDKYRPFKVVEATIDRPGVNEWADLCKVLPHDDYRQIVDAAFELNIWEPQQRRERLGKAASSTSESSSPPASE